MKIIRRLENIFILALILLLFSTANLFSQNSTQNRGFGETWVATDALGRTLPTYNQTGLPRANKFVGIFYWLWHGHTPDSPISDVTKILAVNPQNTQWIGPGTLSYYWAEPEAD